MRLRSVSVVEKTNEKNDGAHSPNRDNKQIFGLMKKIILIASLFISFVGIFVVALPLLLNLTGLSQPVKRYLLASAEKKLPYSINLADFKIGLGTLRFNRVALTSDNQHYRITINSIRLGYRLTSLILHPRKPLHALESITLVQPRLVIRKNGSTSQKKATGAIWSTLQTLVNQLNRENNVRMIRVENGRVYLRRSPTDSLLLVRRLNGILKSDRKDIIEMGADGSFLSRRNDRINLSGRLDLQTKKMRLLCRLVNYDVEKSFVSDFIPDVQKLQGLISGWLLFENSHFDADSLQINGELRFKDFALEYQHRPVESLNFKTVISNNRLIVDSLQARIAQSDVKAKLWVDDIFAPRIQAQIRFSDLNPGTLIDPGQTHWYTQSALDGRLTVQIEPKPWRGKLELQDGRWKFKSGKTLKNVRFKLKFAPEGVHLNDAFARIGAENLLKAQGLYQSNSGRLSVRLHAEHFTAHHVIFDRLSEKMHALDLRFNSNLKTGKIAGNWQYYLTAPSDTILNVSGNLIGDNQHLRIASLHSSVPGFNASLRINDYLHNPTIAEGYIKNFPFQEFTSAELITPLLKRLRSNFQINGPLNRLQLHIALTDYRNPKNQMAFVATLSNLFSGHRVLNGLIRLKNITGNSKMEFGDDYFRGDFHFGNQIKGNLKVDFSREQYLSGAIRFNHFNIVQAFSDTVIANNFHFLGNLNGSIQLRGDINDPMLSMDLKGDRFVFNDVGYYQAGIQLFADKDSVNVDSLYISINNLPVIQGKGKINFRTKKVSAFFSGQNVDTEQLLATIMPGRLHLTGQADYTLGIRGRLLQPVWDLNLNIEDGLLDRLEFDHLFVHMKNDYKDGGSLLHAENQLLKIDRLEIIRNNHFHLSGLGEVPLYSTGPIDLFLNFDGDLFELIPLYQPFFKKGVSNVNLHVALGGTPERIRLSSGFLAISHGALWLKNVAPHIENINGVIEKKSGTNRVNFINLMASTGGETLTINTVRHVKLPDGEILKPWYFKGLDLDFGVLKLETTGRGVQVHLPGFMQPKDFGRLALSGANPNESFYFAGPITHPRLRGKVTIYDTRLTFPFLKINRPPSEKPDVVVEFLQNIDWDLWVTAGEDVVYYRNIPAYIDNVNTELFVDESSPGLHLRGILNNKTFRVSGKLSSSRGRLEYLDQTFRVDYFQAEFTESSPYPFISGQAWTTIRDSIGAVPKTIYLKLYAVDPETHQEKQQGSLENFKFKLVSADPQIGEDQEQVLSYLGFSVGNLREKATSVGGAVTDKYIFRPLFRPIERAIERNLGIDFVRINSNIAKNLFYTSIGYGGRNFGRNQPLINPFNTSMPYLFLMSSSEVTLGKYLTQNLYLTYTGQLVSVYDKTKPTFDMNHSFGIEYRFLRNILLEIEYDRELMGYYKIPNQKQYLEDIKIRLRHSFTF